MCYTLYTNGLVRERKFSNQDSFLPLEAIVPLTSMIGFLLLPSRLVTSYAKVLGIAPTPAFCHRSASVLSRASISAINFELSIATIESPFGNRVMDSKSTTSWLNILFKNKVFNVHCFRAPKKPLSSTFCGAWAFSGNLRYTLTGSIRKKRAWKADIVLLSDQYQRSAWNAANGKASTR